MSDNAKAQAKKAGAALGAGLLTGVFLASVTVFTMGMMQIFQEQK